MQTSTRAYTKAAKCGARYVHRAKRNAETPNRVHFSASRPGEHPPDLTLTHTYFYHALVEVNPPGTSVILGDAEAIIRMGADTELPKWALGTDITKIEWKGFKKKGRAETQKASETATGFSTEQVNAA